VFLVGYAAECVTHPLQPPHGQWGWFFGVTSHWKGLVLNNTMEATNFLVKAKIKINHPFQPFFDTKGVQGMIGGF
jgi:hypothetical protein